MMQKISVFIILLCLSATITQAQKGSIGIGAQYLKNLPLIPKSKQEGYTLSVYYAPTHTAKINLSYSTLNTYITPISGGSIRDFTRSAFVTVNYQQYFGKKKHWFVAPEVGFELFNATLRPAIGFGAGYAYHTKRGVFEAGVRSLHTLKGSAAANTNFQIFVGYKIRLSR